MPRMPRLYLGGNLPHPAREFQARLPFPKLQQPCVDPIKMRGCSGWTFDLNSWCVNCRPVTFLEKVTETPASAAAKLLI
jgi:hypothetical protein